ncbi:hypothetical protein [Flavobacterium chungangense]|uniref:Uncharacterized protein n=1 Tax=Flavobacterium chungangense TaxID=554283 RepID=A0A6V6YR28_9FLAO|nr:hypothetical protein [Flavobacterium chungangense]CAD0001893.1 hypothetical protein FLACHUCJ7_00744 [Flavobacterium chungangense]
MKKLFLILCVFYNAVSFSQTVLNSFSLNLNRPLENGQILNIEDVKTNDIYVFAADDKYINILKYNKSLFLKNQFTDSIKMEKDRSLIGHSIGDDGNPLLYWATNNLRNIRIIKYYLETKTSKALNFDLSPNNENVITTYQKNNNFYMLCKETNRQHLLLYEFNNGKAEVKMFDVSGILFQNDKEQNLAFNTVIRYYPIEKIDPDSFNTLDKTIKKTKMYVSGDHIFLTFDYSLKKTHVLDLNTITVDVTEKNFNQPVSKTPSKTSNSFFYENKLLQIKAGKEELLFEIKDFDSGKTLKSLSVSKKDSVNFKNSPFFLQINDKNPQEIKTTEKFLKQLSTLNAGITVFKNKKNTSISFGGFVEYQISGFDNIQSNLLADFFDNDFGGYSEYSSKMAYFDAMLNSDLEFVKNKQSEPLAIDNVFYYLSINKNISLQNILKLKDYYILSYYDIASKQYIMRKFTDGFYYEEKNSIINKAIFSQPISFYNLKSTKN